MTDYKNPFRSGRYRTPYDPVTFNPFGEKANVRAADSVVRPGAAPSFNYLDPVAGYVAPVYETARDAVSSVGDVVAGGPSDPAPAPTHSAGSLPGVLDLIAPGSTHADRAANIAIDQFTGLPFGIASTLINPRIVDTSWGTPFNTGGGGIIGAGGELSRRNLERVYAQALQEHAPSGEGTPEYLQEAFGGGAIPTHAPGATTNFYAPGQVPGVNTPIATHEGFIPGTRVVSGNTDLITGLSPREGQSTVFADEVDAFAQERIRAEQEQAALAAAEEAERERIRQEQEDAAAARLAEIEQRRVREAAEQARAEAQRQANIRAANEELARRNREREESGQAQQQGRAVTDRHGNPVRDSGGGIVTDRPTERDSDGGGGGGGGRWVCSVMFHEGHWTMEEFKQMTRWSLKFAKDNPWWLGGYNRWGKWVAKNLVKNSPFWQSVTQAFYDYNVHGRRSWKARLAQAVIYPGSLIAHLNGAQAPKQFRLATKEELE